MKKKLYRSSTDRYLAGVCGGIAEYFNWPARYVRISYLIFTILCSFSSRLLILPVGLYLILYLALPQKTAGGTWSSFLHGMVNGAADQTASQTKRSPSQRKILRDAHERKNK